MRNVKIIVDSFPVPVGTLTVNQPLPTNALRYADPFLLLHHGPERKITPGSDGIAVPEHPHRGFEPVTFVFSGEMLHTDSLGNVGRIGAGEVQWITSGKGIMHEEATPPELNRDGGKIEIIQLWVNLPAEKKMMDPGYQEIRATAMPAIDLLDGNLNLSLVAGQMSGETGPAKTQSELIAAMGKMTAGGSGIVDVTDMDTLAIYVLDGSMTINGDNRVDAGRLVVFDPGKGGFQMDVNEDGKILFLAGVPLDEPVYQHGPFVMTTEEEIRTAFRDYAGGKFGSIK